MKLKSLLITLIVLLSSCGRSTVYHTYQTVNADGWQRTDTLLYPIPSDIPEGDYTLEIGLRHHEDYAYRDLWIAYGFGVPTDTACLTLAYKSGNWHGHGAAGLYQFTEYVPAKFHLAEARTDSVLRLVHVMRDKHLRGICDVGIRLVKE
jgi:gliding motility-associated lipoprotein GldH